MIFLTAYVKKKNKNSHVYHKLKKKFKLSYYILNKKKT